MYYTNRFYTVTLLLISFVSELLLSSINTPHGLNGLYSVRYSSHSLSAQGGISLRRDATTTNAVETVCTAVAMCLPLNDSSVVVQFDSVRISQSLNGSAIRGIVGAAERDLLYPLTLFINAHGLVARVALHDSVQDDSYSLIMSMCSMVCGLPVSLQDTSPLPHQRDRVGEFTSYVSLCGGGDIVQSDTQCIRRVKGMYRVERSARARAKMRTASITIPNDTCVVRSIGGKVVAVHATENHATFVGSERVASFGAACTLNALDSGYAPMLLSGEKSLPRYTRVYAPDSSLWDVQHSVAKQLLGTMLFASILDTLDRITIIAPQDSLRSEILLRNERLLVAACHVWGDSCVDSIAARMRSMDIQDARMLLFMRVCATVGTNKAQQNLSGVLRRCADNEKALISFIPTCNSVRLPAKELLSCMYQFAFSHSQSFIRSTTQLCLASLAGNAMEFGGAVADEILDSLLVHKSKYSTRQFLLIAGNSGSQRLFPHVARYINDSSSSVRNDALHALRFIETPSADSLLSLHAQYGDSTARAIALRAMVLRNPSPLLQQTLLSISAQHNDSEHALRAITILIKWLEEFPQLHPTLLQHEQVLRERNSDADVLHALQSALEEFASR